MTKYQQGARLERLACHKAIEEGAICSIRAAGSKSYGKYKLDVVHIFKDKVILEQHKKGLMSKKEKDGLKELAELLMEPIPVIVRYVERAKEEKK